MSNNFDLRKFLTENKLTPTAKLLNEAVELSPIEQELVNAVIGDVNEAIDLGKILNKVKLLASKGLLTVAMASAILASCGTAGNSDEIFKRELDNLKKVDSIEHVQKTRIDSISNDIKSSPTTATIKEYEHHYRKVGGECRKYNDEGDYTVVSMQYCQYNEEAPVSEMNGGYIEVMGDEFDEATDQLALVWERWKNGPATEDEDIEPAKADILQYIKSVILK
jgi:hypothetical protein